MFKLSKGAEYAIRSILYLSRQRTGRVCYSEEISKNQEIPRAYLAKVFQALGRKGIIKSMRGTKGGVTLLKAPELISVYDVIIAVEGDIFLNDCLIHEGFCHRDPVCSAHRFWHSIQEKFCALLQEANFQTLADDAGHLEKNNPAVLATKDVATP